MEAYEKRNLKLLNDGLKAVSYETQENLFYEIQEFHKKAVIDDLIQSSGNVCGFLKSILKAVKKQVDDPDTFFTILQVLRHDEDKFIDYVEKVDRATALNTDNNEELMNKVLKEQVLYICYKTHEDGRREGGISFNPLKALNSGLKFLIVPFEDFID